MPPPRFVLTLNAGSSSLKSKLFEWTGALRAVASANVQRLGTPKAALSVDSDAPTPLDAPTLAEAVKAALRGLGIPPNDPRVVAVGHRVVHGGAVTASRLWTAEVDAAVAAATPLAPLHNPANAAAARAAKAALPAAAHVAVFDTSFHAATLPAAARAIALPRSWPDTWRVRTGFHGTSYRGVVAALARELGVPPSDVHAVAFHLGAGASACAISSGTSLDTSMGATPTAGLISATRCGDADPGLFALRAAALAREGASADAISADLAAAANTDAGLLALGGAADYRDVAAAAAGGDDCAAAALEAVAWRCQSYLGSYMHHLRVAGTPARAIAFTGGIGENAAALRAAVVAGLAGGGGPRVELDPARNAAAVGLSAPATVSAPDSEVAVVVVPCDEEATIAGDAVRVGVGGDVAP